MWRANKLSAIWFVFQWDIRWRCVTYQWQWKPLCASGIVCQNFMNVRYFMFLYYFINFKLYEFTYKLIFFQSILSCSPLLRNLFKSMGSSEQSIFYDRAYFTVYLPSFNVLSIKALLQFMYTGEVGEYKKWTIDSKWY